MSNKKEELIRQISASFNYSDKVKKSPQKFWYEHYPNALSIYAYLVIHRNERVLKKATGGERLLDIGCGFGDLLYLLKDRYRVLYGIDPSIDMIKQTKTNLRVRNVSNEMHISQGIAELLDFEDSFFNTVLMLDVYEHIRPTERIKALSEVKRVLKPGGELILTTPSRRTLRLWNIFNNMLLIYRRFSNREKIRIWSFDPKDYTEEFCAKHELIRDMYEVGLEFKNFERVGFYPAAENPGYFGIWLHKTSGKRGVHRAIKSFFELMASLAVLNQKMLVRCCK